MRQVEPRAHLFPPSLQRTSINSSISSSNRGIGCTGSLRVRTCLSPRPMRHGQPTSEGYRDKGKARDALDPAYPGLLLDRASAVGGAVECGVVEHENVLREKGETRGRHQRVDPRRYAEHDSHHPWSSAHLPNYGISTSGPRPRISPRADAPLSIPSAPSRIAAR